MAKAKKTDAGRHCIANPGLEAGTKSSQHNLAKKSAKHSIDSPCKRLAVGMMYVKKRMMPSETAMAEVM